MLKWFFSLLGVCSSVSKGWSWGVLRLRCEDSWMGVRNVVLRARLRVNWGEQTGRHMKKSQKTHIVLAPFDIHLTILLSISCFWCIACSRVTNPNGLCTNWGWTCLWRSRKWGKGITWWRRRETEICMSSCRKVLHVYFLLQTSSKGGPP